MAEKRTFKVNGTDAEKQAFTHTVTLSEEGNDSGHGQGQYISFEIEGVPGNSKLYDFRYGHYDFDNACRRLLTDYYGEDAEVERIA